MIGAAMERKVTTRTGTGAVYPNLFTLLVAPPGVGKGVALAKTEELFGELDKLHYAPSSITAAALVDVLAEAKRSIMRLAANPPLLEFHSLYAVAPELGVLVPQYDPQMMNTLNDLYDCRNKPFTQRRRTKDLKISIKNPQLSILGACTPSFLKELLPDGAWDQGFISRTIMVFSGEAVRRPLFEMPVAQDAQRAALLQDLRAISELQGNMRWDDDAAGAISEWDLSGGNPKPDHPKLIHYITRRSIHMIKLCMIASVCRSSELLITMEDWLQAKSWLEEVEAVMPDLFRWTGVTGDREVMDECYNFVFRNFLKDQKPVLESRVIRFLSEKLPSYAVAKVYDIMKQDGTLIADSVGALAACRPGRRDAEY
jgi:hypothetical protein